MIIRRLRTLFSSVRFLIVNLKAFAALPRFCELDLPGGMIFRGCKQSDVRAVVALRKQLDGHTFSWVTRMLLRAIPGKCCVVISNRHGGLNALSLFYFNERDILDVTVHEGFIGVSPEHAGKGLATGIRRLATDHFSKAGVLRGISSRITLSNSASVSSGGKAGYELLDIYRDELTGEERGYFIKRFHHETRQ